MAKDKSEEKKDTNIKHKQQKDLIDISKHIDKEINKNVFNPKVIILLCTFSSIAIVLGLSIVLLINFFN